MYMVKIFVRSSFLFKFSNLPNYIKLFIIYSNQHQIVIVFIWKPFLFNLSDLPNFSPFPAVRLHLGAAHSQKILISMRLHLPRLQLPLSLFANAPFSLSPQPSHSRKTRISGEFQMPASPASSQIDDTPVRCHGFGL